MTKQRGKGQPKTTATTAKDNPPANTWVLNRILSRLQLKNSDSNGDQKTQLNCSNNF
ncbi:hypothetical protein PtB15_10B35 [Puccinia triticina]|nr:hypothetical protein PtB15_10B35 [Puccinia triticina]